MPRTSRRSWRCRQRPDMPCDATTYGLLFVAVGGGLLAYIAGFYYLLGWLAS